MSQKIPYYAPSGVLQRWNLHEGAQGCTRLDPNDVNGAYLSLDNAPPLTVAEIAKQKAAEVEAEHKHQAERKAKGYGFFRGALLEAAEQSALKKAQEKAAPPPKPAAPVAKFNKPKVEPLDLQDIPGAMDKMGWTKSAELMRQFFAGELNYSPKKDNERDGIDQNGNFYGPQFIEKKRFTWEWLRKYPGVDDAFNAIQRPEELFSEKKGVSRGSAHSTLLEMATNLVRSKPPRFMGTISTMDECGGDVFELHRRFQFQHHDMGYTSFPNTDLAGSLGDFSIYAAIAKAEVERDEFKGNKVRVTHVYLYVKDNFSFTDAPNGPSQYLGHWNKNCVIYSPLALIANQVPTLPQLGGRGFELNIPIARSDAINPFFDGSDFPLLMGNQLKAENIFYPLRNRDFWNWQMQHKRGGNILSFSDFKSIYVGDKLHAINLPHGV